MTASLPSARPAFNPWPWALIAFFVVLVTTITSFVVFALRQDLELVRPDYYEQELRHDQQMQRVHRTEGVAGAIALSASGDRIVVDLPLDHARRKSAGTIHLYRPSDSHLDREFDLTPGRDGRQTLDTRDLRPGLWKVRVAWTVDGAEYFREATVVVPSPAA